MTNTIIKPQQGGTGIQNGANNAITFTGNFSLGITLSGNTSVTFPTSGTLLTTAGQAATVATINGLISAGTNITITGSGTSGSPYVINSSGGSGSPGGSNTQVQYNNSGAFGGSSDFTWNNATKIFQVGDVGGALNSTVFGVDDSTKTVYAFANGVQALTLDGDNSIYSFGAPSGGNGTYLEVNDVDQGINLFANHGMTLSGTDGNNSYGLTFDAVVGQINWNLTVNANQVGEMQINNNGFTFSTLYDGTPNTFLFAASEAGFGNPGTVRLGYDVVNGTYLEIDDDNERVTITNVPTFADDAAAGVGGLTQGQIYKTTTLGSTFLKIVP